MRDSAISPAPGTDWFGNPISQTCTRPWCEGDCVLGGPGDLAHHKSVVEMPLPDGRRVFVLLQQSGDETPNVYVSTGPSDEHGVELTVDQAVEFFAAGLAGALNLRGQGSDLRVVA